MVPEHESWIRLGRENLWVLIELAATNWFQHGAGKKAIPLAVVAAPRINQGAAKRVLEFAEQYAPDVAVGLIDFDGLRVFRGEHLEELNAAPRAKSAIISTSARVSGHLFDRVTDVIRDAARIQPNRQLQPADIRAASQYGIEELFSSDATE